MLDDVKNQFNDKAAKAIAAYQEELKKDRTKSQILGFTKLNLLEMTRKNMCNNDYY